MAGITAALIGGGIAIAGDVYKGIQGANQKSQAAQLAKSNPFIPETMPSSVTAATQLAQQNYTNGMPGTQMAENRIRRGATNATAAASRGASSGGDILDAANKIQKNSNDATLDLAMKAASYKSNALGGYEAALGTQAGWQDKLYQNNQLQPYLRSANTAASLQGAGSINENNAIDGASTVIQSGLQDYNNSQYRNLLMGNGQTMGSKYGQSQLPSANSAGINTNQLLAASMYNINP